ncbi:MAG TPA: hypothetical protein VLE02_02100 [Nitrosarchaeum sp.]|nr:hypothetical protein [Nitrosarchaeum sp.]
MECQHSRLIRIRNKTSGKLGWKCFLCQKKSGDVCLHLDRYEDDAGVLICPECKCETIEFDFKPEWRFYEQTSKNSARCRSPSDADPLKKTLNALQIEVHGAIKRSAIKKYLKVSKGATTRNSRRVSLIAVCLYFSFADYGEPRPTDVMCKQFNIDRKEMSSAMNEYYEVFPDDRKRPFEPKDYVTFVAKLVGIKEPHIISRIIKLCRVLDKTSVLIQRSAPQSVSAAAIYFYLYMDKKYCKELGITKLHDFAVRVDLSEITIQKLSSAMTEVFAKAS